MRVRVAWAGALALTTLILSSACSGPSQKSSPVTVHPLDSAGLGRRIILAQLRPDPDAPNYVAATRLVQQRCGHHAGVLDISLSPAGIQALTTLEAFATVHQCMQEQPFLQLLGGP